jgi:hypothetical protein
MNRPCQWLFNGLMAFSLCLCILTIAILLESFFFRDDFNYGWADHQSKAYQARIIVTRGFLQLNFERVTGNGLGDFGFSHIHVPARQSVFFPHYFGADYVRFPKYGETFEQWYAWTPIGALILLFAIGPAWWLMRRRARLNRIASRSHFCGHCGYDLRATPDRCPECGTIPPIIRDQIDLPAERGQ